MKHLHEAVEHGWKVVHHEVSAEKDGTVYRGALDRVLARVAEHQANEDYARADAARRNAQHEEIDRLVRRFKLQLSEHEDLWSQYKNGSGYGRRKSLDEATAILEKVNTTLGQVLDFPRDVLLKNEAFGRIRGAAKESTSQE